MKENIMNDLKIKLQEAGTFAADKLHDGVEWVRRNREESALFASGALAMGEMLYRAHKRHQRTEELRWHERHIYDPSSGVYLPLRKPLTGREAARFSDLRRSGLSATESLRRMGKLKH